MSVEGPIWPGSYILSFKSLLWGNNLGALWCLMSKIHGLTLYDKIHNHFNIVQYAHNCVMTKSFHFIAVTLILWKPLLMCSLTSMQSLLKVVFLLLWMICTEKILLESLYVRKTFVNEAHCYFQTDKMPDMGWLCVHWSCLTPCGFKNWHDYGLWWHLNWCNLIQAWCRYNFLVWLKMATERGVLSSPRIGLMSIYSEDQHTHNNRTCRANYKHGSNHITQSMFGRPCLQGRRKTDHLVQRSRLKFVNDMILVW